MMGDRNGKTNSGASGSMLSLLAGAALGAAGLGWWLLAEAELDKAALAVPEISAGEVGSPS